MSGHENSTVTGGGILDALDLDALYNPTEITKAAARLHRLSRLAHLTACGIHDQEDSNPEDFTTLRDLRSVLDLATHALWRICPKEAPTTATVIPFPGA